MPEKVSTIRTRNRVVHSGTSALSLTRKNYFPQSFKLIKKITPTQFLVLLLIVASFLIGVLLTTVYFQQKMLTLANSNNQAAAPSGAQQPSQQQQGLTDGQKANVGNGGFPVLGNQNAKVTIVEFADFRCPFCESFFTNTYPQLKKDYIDTGKVQMYFRNFAFLGDASTFATNAAECANDQGKFWDFHDYLYKNQPSESDTSMYNVDTLSQAAANLGLNAAQFRDCLSNKKDDAKQAKDLSEGQAAGVSGTPTFFINGTALIGAQPYSAFKTVIDQALSK